MELRDVGSYPRLPTIQPTASSSIPPSLLPSASSNFLSTLSRTSRRHALDPASPSSAFSATRGRRKPQDELRWEGARLIWTKGGSVYRTFSYEDEGVKGAERVTQALFAEFGVAADAVRRGSGPTTSSTPLAATSSSSSVPLTSRNDSLFGPYFTPPSTSWSDSPLPLPPHPTPPQPPLSTKRQRVLLVFLSSLAFAYPLDGIGGRIVVPLSMRVKRAWALDGDMGGGVLVERAREGREVWDKGGGSGSGGATPTLWTLTGLMEEMKPVCAPEELAFARAENGEGEKGEVHGIVSGHQTPLHDLDEQLIYASSSPSPSTSSLSSTSISSHPTPPILVTSSPLTRRLRIYTFARVSPSPATLTYSDLPAASPSSEKGKARASTSSTAAPPSANALLVSSSPILTRSGLALSTTATTAGAPPMRPSLSGTKRKHAPSSPPRSRHSRSVTPLSPAEELDQPSYRLSAAGLPPPPDRNPGEDRSIHRRLSSALGNGPAYPSSLPGRPRNSLTRLPSLSGQAQALAEGQEAELLLEAGRSFSGAGGLGPALNLNLPPGPETGVQSSSAAARRRQPDRRVSLTRLPLGQGAGGPSGPAAHELSVTMDRMALSQGSNASTVMSFALTGGGGLGEQRDRVWGELEREDLGDVTRMIGEGVGEQGAGQGAEVVAKCIWEGEVDGLSFDGPIPEVSLFDIRSSYLSSSSSSFSSCATLAVHFRSTSTLLLFSISSTSTDSGVTLSATPLRSISSVLSATPVLATRRRTGVQDLLVLTTSLDTEGKKDLSLLTAEGVEMSAHLDLSGGGRDIIKLDGAGGTEAVLTRADGSRRVASFVLSSADGDEDNLRERCLEALAQVLSLEDFSRLLSSVFERERQVVGGRRKMQALEDVLDDVFGVSASARNRKGKGKERVGEQDPFEVFLAAQAQTADASRDPIAALLRPLPCPSASSPQDPSIPFAPPATLSPQQAAILFALHLLVQDLLLLSSPQAREESKKLRRKVGQWASRVGLHEWSDAYWRMFGGECVTMEFGEGGADALRPTPAAVPPSFPLTPPLLLSSLSSLLSAPTPLAAARVASHLPSAFSLSSVATHLDTSLSFPSNFYGSTDPTRPLQNTAAVLELYTSLTTSIPDKPSASDSTTSRAHRTVALLHSYISLTPPSSRPFASLEDLNFAVALPLREAVRMAQLDPPEPGSQAAVEVGWVGEKAAGCYRLVGREDLERQCGGGGVEGAGVEQVRVDDGDVRGIEEIVKGAWGEVAKKVEKGAGGLQKTTLTLVPAAERFSEDKRLEEVQRMLQYWEPVVISAGERTLDQLTPQIQQSILLALSQRTLALPIGQGLFTYRTRPAPSPSASSPPSSSTPDPFSIAKIVTSARIVPMPSPVALIEKDRGDPTNPPTTPDRFEWPEFHSGVVSALQMRFDPLAVSVDSSQISFNRPTDLDSAHAGLLFGLGLTGQLGAMLSSQAYEYLKAKHDPTSVGLLLGLAVNYLATADPTVTSVVSIHLPALHPPRSSSLNVSGMTQAAAAVSLGLVHFGTGRRSYADVLVNELCGFKVSAVEDAAACREAYALACGFGFGMIMLGKGRGMKPVSSAGLDGLGGAGEKEVEHLRIFRTLILGGYGGSSVTGDGAHSVDTSITSPAATVALALTYLRSGRADVAAIFALPDTPRALDYVRHDLLLLRTVARSLIMWEETNKGKDWVEGCLPTFLREAADVATKTGRPMDGDFEVARWSIVAGACYAIGMRYAGTAAAEAHATLIHYLDRLTRACYAKTSSVQGKIKRHALRSCLGALALALSMVMAGTGEINVLRRLRVAHGLFSEGLTYGSHVATHMALGLLFLGRGQYALGTSDTAITALLISLYPAFPSASTENRGHLQAFRHLWVLAVEPRYLDARDVDTGEPVFLPVKLRLADSVSESSSMGAVRTELRSKQLVAPTLIPDLRLIDSIQIDSPRYWSYSVRLAQNPQHLARFLRSSTLYIKRRTGHLSYAQDPRGIRSIFTRSKSETGSSVFDLGEMGRMLSASSSGLRDFVAAFSGSDVEAVAATRELCYHSSGANGRLPSAFEAFAASALLECLTKDKRDVVSVYHALFAAAASLSVDSLVRPDPGGADLLFQAAQLHFVVSFYKNGAFKALFSKPKASSSSSKSSSSTSGQVSRDPLISPAFIDHLSLRLSSICTDLLASESVASSLRTYLANSDSSSSIYPSRTSTALAFTVAALRIPTSTLLSSLKQLVQQSAAQPGFGREEAAVVLRMVGKKVAEQLVGVEAEEEGAGKKSGRGSKVGSAWEREAEKWMVESWVETEGTPAM
ncbi:hypothetical protein JCM11251_007657 [Rhodosporidiobolus azoricus]